MAALRTAPPTRCSTRPVDRACTVSEHANELGQGRRDSCGAAPRASLAQDGTPKRASRLVAGACCCGCWLHRRG
jgi:hypothetical protein